MQNRSFHSISDMLIKYADSSYIRFHMPGHGGIGYDNFLNSIFKYDVTENSGTDNLYSPVDGGYVENTLNKLKSTYGTVASVISAHGATAAIQSSVYACIRLKGKRFLIERQAHASVLNAMTLSGCTFEFFSSFEDLENKIKENVNSTVIITSPNYYGKMADVKKYSQLCKSYNCLLVVDNSHGSHLLWHGKNAHPVFQGADFCIDSYHKTLPVLTGGAVLHSNVCDEKLLFEGIKLFSSTSPSYLIAASVDLAIDLMNKNGRELLTSLYENISAFDESIKDTGIERERFDISDPYRITLVSKSFDGLRYDIDSLSAFLESKSIFPEFSDGERCVLIPSVFSRRSDFKALSDAVCEFSFTHKRVMKSFKKLEYPMCKRAMSISQAVFSDKENISVNDSVGAVSGEIKYIYPPGIPIITPGEIISDDVVRILTENNIHKIEVILNEESKT